jgi:hypothetical protein
MRDISDWSIPCVDYRSAGILKSRGLFAPFMFNHGFANWQRR